MDLLEKQDGSTITVSDIEERATFCDLQRNQGANCGEVQPNTEESHVALLHVSKWKRLRVSPPIFGGGL